MRYHHPKNTYRKQRSLIYIIDRLVEAEKRRASASIQGLGREAVLSAVIDQYGKNGELRVDDITLLRNHTNPPAMITVEADIVNRCYRI